MKFNKSKGISLIVLIITIIVITILTGSIIITASTSNIIREANKAVNNSNKANGRQTATLAKAEYELISPNEKENITLRSYVENKLRKTGFTDAAINEIIDEEGNILQNEMVDKILIPKGFYHVGGTKETGLIISDNAADKGKGLSHEDAKGLKGNQFVWVPVENFTEFVRYDFQNNSNISNSYKEITPRENKYEEVEKMYESVKKYKGFYVGRYETGIAETMSKPTSSTILYANGNNKPQIKMGTDTWIHIPWGGTAAQEAYDGYQGNDNSNGAVLVSRSLYPDNKTNSKGANSHLIYGVQWDAIMRWFKNSGISVSDSRTWGNHKDSTGEAAAGRYKLQKTGYNPAWNQKGIYDIAGNVWEWTMEAGSNTYRVYRSGSYDNSGTDNSASRRNQNITPDYSSAFLGFRIALYIK